MVNKKFMDQITKRDEIYKFGENVLKDIIFSSLNHMIYHSEFESDRDEIIEEMFGECFETIVEIYKEMHNKDDIIKYIDFDVLRDYDDTYFRVVCNNLATSLWFNGIFPTDFNNIVLRGNFETKNKIYTFDKKKKKLIVKNLKS